MCCVDLPRPLGFVTSSCADEHATSVGGKITVDVLPSRTLVVWECRLFCGRTFHVPGHSCPATVECRLSRPRRAWVARVIKARVPCGALREAMPNPERSPLCFRLENSGRFSGDALRTGRFRVGVLFFGFFAPRGRHLFLAKRTEQHMGGRSGSLGHVHGEMKPRIPATRRRLSISCCRVQTLAAAESPA